MPQRRTENELREAWHAEHMDLAEWLEEFVGNDADSGRLTPHQQRALIFWQAYVERGRLMRQATLFATDLRREIQDLEAMPAGSGNVTEIPNGSFDVRVDIEDATYHRVNVLETRNFQFQIWTVQNGRLEGQRIIKRREVYGMGPYRGFATLTAAGTLHLWQRFQADGDEPYVHAARELLTEILWRSDGEGLLRPIYEVESESQWIWPVEHEGRTHRYHLNYVISCRVCNDTETARDNVAMRNTGFCRDHWESFRLLETSPYVFDQEEARANLRMDPVTPIRTTALAMCEITGTEIQ